MNRQTICSFMQQFRYGVVSSTARSGAPQSALVGIATTSAMEVIFDTVTSSRKYANLISRPSCSLVVGWGGEQTVQLEGLAFEPHGPEMTRYQEEYFAVWPDGRNRTHWPGLTYFVVKPLWVRYCDYDRRPPIITEMFLKIDQGHHIEGSCTFMT